MSVSKTTTTSKSSFNVGAISAVLTVSGFFCMLNETVLNMALKEKESDIMCPHRKSRIITDGEVQEVFMKCYKENCFAYREFELGERRICCKCNYDKDNIFQITRDIPKER